MPPRTGQRTYQYKATDNPLTVAQQFNLQPNQLLSGNPGGTPFTTGQQINIPNFMSPGAPNPYQAALNAQPPARPSPRTAMGIAGAAMGVINPQTPTNFTTANSFYTPPQVTPPTNFASGNSFASGSNVNTQPGMNNQQFVLDVGERILANPAEFDNLPKSAQDAIRQSLGQGAGTVTNSAGSGSAEFMNTGFMQQNAANGTSFENQLRWDPDRKKYVKIGKLIAEGRLNPKDKNARLQRKRNRGGGGAKPQQAREDPNGRLAGVGLVSFSVGGG